MLVYVYRYSVKYILNCDKCGHVALRRTIMVIILYVPRSALILRVKKIINKKKRYSHSFRV